MYKYFPHTEEEIAEMLRKIGVKSLDDLYADIPKSMRFKGDYELPDSMSELEIRRVFDVLGNMNDQLVCFAGAGIYDHYTPSVVPNLIERSEFLTSYTPYQAEISQGTLHYIFEYQSMMTELTGMDVSNASMYDGATATAEAMLMAYNNNKKAEKVLISETVDPKVRRVVETYAKYHGVRIVSISEKEGVTDREDLHKLLSQGDVAGVIVQSPNYYGIIEDYTGFADACHDQKALFIMNSIAADLAILKTPKEWGADIAVGDGQSLGIPMTFGGPSIGYMCVTEKLMRKMPGRIVGMTKDAEGKRVFVLTLQAREQAAEQSYSGAHYLQQRLLETGRFTPTYNQPFFNEFCVDYHGDVAALQQACIEQGFLAGVKVGSNTLMFAVTEKRTIFEIDKLLETIQDVIKTQKGGKR